MNVPSEVCAVNISLHPWLVYTMHQVDYCCLRKSWELPRHFHCEVGILSSTCKPVKGAHFWVVHVPPNVPMGRCDQAGDDRPIDNQMLTVNIGAFGGVDVGIHIKSGVQSFWSRPWCDPLPTKSQVGQPTSFHLCQIQHITKHPPLYCE